MRNLKLRVFARDVSFLIIGLFVLIGFIYLVSAATINSVTLNATSTVNLTMDNLTATVSVSPSNTSILYEWYKDSVLSAVFLGNSTFQNTIPYWFTDVAEVWYVNATPKNLTNNYNITNASYVDNLTVTAYATSPRSLEFNNNGTKLFVLGRNGQDIDEYNLTTAFDVSTGVYVNSYSISSEESEPTSMLFNNDGTSLYIVGTSNDEVNEYELLAPFDLSTRTPIDTFDVSAQEAGPSGMTFNNDGTKFYVIGSTSDNVSEYNLSTPYDVSTSVYNHGLSVTSQDVSPLDITFNNDGTSLYMLGFVGNDITQYSLTTAFDVSTATPVGTFPISEDTDPRGILFNNDGTSLYVTGVTNNGIYEYDMGSVEDGVSVLSNNLTIFSPTIDSIVLNSTSTNNLTTDNLTVTPVGLNPADSSVQYDWYRDSVLSAVFLGNSSFQNTIPYWFTTLGDVWYVITTPKNLTGNYDVSTGVHKDNFSVASQDATPSGMAFNNDGTKLYMVGNDNDEIYEYNLSTAFDVSRGVYSDNLSIGSEETLPIGMTFNNDGTKLYVVGNNGTNSGAIHEYNLSTAFDVSTGVLNDNLSVSTQDTEPRSVIFNNDGTKVYVTGNEKDSIYEYNLSTPYGVSTGVYNDNLSIGSEDATPIGMTFNNDGTKLYLVGNQKDAIYEYNLSTPFDVSTGIYNDNLSVGSKDTAPRDVRFNNDGTKLYVIGRANDRIYEYDVGTLEAGPSVTSENLTIINETEGSEDENSSTTEPTTESSSGGGTSSFYPSEEDLEDGYERRVLKNSKFKFEVGGEKHTIVINNITKNSISLSIRSDEQYVTLLIGETKKVDLNHSGFYDLEIFLKDINAARADIIITTINEEIPTQLFDITFNLDDFRISNSDELVAVVTFESFGTVPTPVNLTFIILDSSGNEIYREESEVIVTTEEVLRWNYESLEELSEGKYTVILETLYNVDIRDEFRQEFEVSVEKEEGNFWFWVIVGISVLVIGVAGYLLLRGINKRQK